MKKHQAKKIISNIETKIFDELIKYDKLMTREIYLQDDKNRLATIDKVIGLSSKSAVEYIAVLDDTFVSVSDKNLFSDYAYDFTKSTYKTLYDPVDITTELSMRITIDNHVRIKKSAAYIGAGIGGIVGFVVSRINNSNPSESIYAVGVGIFAGAVIEYLFHPIFDLATRKYRSTIEGTHAYDNRLKKELINAVTNITDTK